MAMFNVGFWRGEATWENVNRWGHAVCSTILTPKVLEHPAFFGFYFADEPRWNGVPAINLQMCAETLRKITPYHPKHIVAAPRGSVEDHLPYAAAADFYGIDIYPVRRFPFQSGGPDPYIRRQICQTRRCHAGVPETGSHDPSGIRLG